jgi:hypothetical protein
VKKLAIMQPYLFPYLGYFQLIQAVDEFVIYDDVQFIMRGWINRNNLLVGNKKSLFSIQLDHASQNKLINEVQITDDFTRLRRTIQHAYARAPYREPVLNLLSGICDYEDKNVARFTGHSLQVISGYLGLRTQFVYSSDLHKDNSLKGPEKILAICKELKATTYINAMGGRELYDAKDFRIHDIELKFIQPQLPPYEQFGAEFIPGLSIIDVMMFNSVADINTMLGNYELV